jgi:hypothetical protein
MKHVRIGDRIISPAQITHVEIVGESKRVGVWFVGAQKPLDFYGNEADAVLAVIDATVIHIQKDEALDKLMESLDLKS